LKEKNCRTLVECTPNYLGRDVHLLQRLSKETGLNIITNTGYYGAVNHKYLPRHVYTESAAQIAKRWINEYENGIDGTGIKPGFLKLSADKGPLSPIQRKVITAGAMAHKRTGLPIAIHSGDGRAALEEFAILRENDVPASAFIWVHAQNEKNYDVFRQIASQGAWVEFDGLNEENVKEYVQLLKFMKQHNLLKRTLVSHDAGFYNVGEKDGGSFRSYTTLYTHLLPLLQKEGFSDAEVDMLTRTNPAAAFSIRLL
jgi:phosphotriesterase-related protein